MAPPTLSSLPREVYLMIVEALARPQDLNSLCQVSKSFYAETVPYLYRSLSLYTTGQATEPSSSTPYGLAAERGLLRHARHIELRPDPYDPNRLCLHRIIERLRPLDGGGYSIVSSDPVAELETVLRNCEPDTLKSLDWQPGTCMTLSVLEPDGYFAREQHGLESIRLVTDGNCALRAPREHRLALSSFPHLRRFAWAGATSQVDLDTLTEVLSQRSAQLEAFEIDLTQCRDLADEDPPSLDLYWRDGLRLTALRELSFVAVSLAVGETKDDRRVFLERIDGAVDFGALRSLTLRDCTGWEELTKLLAERADNIRLRSLEIQWSHNSGPLEPYEALLPFLHSFNGLEELCVHATTYDDSRPLWGAVLNHRASLRRFVHHQRLQDRPDPDQLFVEACDTWDQPFSVLDGVEDDSLGRLDLTCLGLSCNPLHLRSFVSGFAAKKSLRVLHVRQSGPDMSHYPSWAESADDHDPCFDISAADFEGADFPALGTSFIEFAQWAFGPDGIRSLRLLAYGDFSCDGRFADTSLLFCRREGKAEDGDGGEFLYFREVREDSDWELWDLFESEKRFLAACPSDTLLRNIET